MALQVLHSAIDRLSLAPGIRHLLRQRYDRFFFHNAGQNLFRGLYESYDAAADAVRALESGARGYDSDEAAELYTEWLDVFDYDYPALFWVHASFAEGLRRVFDLGGNVGIKYYAYQKLKPFPEDAAWTVADVPAVVRKGRAIATTRDGKKQLAFTERLDDMDASDLLFASGSLQYLPWTLSELLAGLRAKPKRILVNITAIHPTETYYTVNSFGPGFSAYRVQAYSEFRRSIEQQGYRLRAEWKNEGKTLFLPFHPAHRLDYYSGFCFDHERAS